MISFARAGLLGGLLVAASPLAAQTTVPAGLSARVAESVARQWGVAPAAIRLEWGRVAANAHLADAAPFRLLGRGDDGWYAVLVGPDSAPAAVRLRAGHLDSVVVAARAVAARSTLAADDLRVDARVRWGAPSRDDRFAPQAGWTTTRAYAAGEAFSSSGVGAPPLVRGGEAVHVTWARGGVAIDMQGTALAAGVLGQTIPVRLTGRAGQRSAVVAGPGLVRLDS